MVQFFSFFKLLVLAFRFPAFFFPFHVVHRKGLKAALFCTSNSLSIPHSLKIQGLFHSLRDMILIFTIKIIYNCTAVKEYDSFTVDNPRYFLICFSRKLGKNRSSANLQSERNGLFMHRHHAVDMDTSTHPLLLKTKT